MSRGNAANNYPFWKWKRTEKKTKERQFSPPRLKNLEDNDNEGILKYMWFPGSRTIVDVIATAQGVQKWNSWRWKKHLVASWRREVNFNVFRISNNFYSKVIQIVDTMYVDGTVFSCLAQKVNRLIVLFERLVKFDFSNLNIFCEKFGCLMLMREIWNAFKVCVAFFPNASCSTITHAGQKPL